MNITDEQVEAIVSDYYLVDRGVYDADNITCKHMRKVIDGVLKNVQVMPEITPEIARRYLAARGVLSTNKFHYIGVNVDAIVIGLRKAFAPEPELICDNCKKPVYRSESKFMPQFVYHQDTNHTSCDLQATIKEKA